MFICCLVGFQKGFKQREFIASRITSFLSSCNQLLARFSCQALRRGVAEEVCRLLLLVSQEEGALLARQHPGIIAQAAPGGIGASGSSPVAAPVPGASSAPGVASQAGTAASAPAASAGPVQFSQPAHLPIAPGPVLNGSGPVASTIAQQSPAQAAAPAQSAPAAAAPAAGPPAQSPATPAAVGLPTMVAGLPPGVAANGAYQRAVHAAKPAGLPLSV